MPPVREITLDEYSPLDHLIGTGDHPTLNTAPSWVPAEERRRLDAYKVLAAFRGNSARHWYQGGDDEDREGRREYGDADLLVRRVVAGVLGDDTQIVVEGADVEIPAMPPLPEEPEEPGEDASDIERRIYGVAHARWEAEATAIVDEWERQLTEQPGLRERQAWLRRWDEDEMFTARHLVDWEDHLEGLGDSVMVISASPEADRPVIDVYDPGLYFPVHDDTERGFPSRHHIAWEFKVKDERGQVRRFVRRLTWELAPIPWAETDDGEFTMPVDPPDAGVTTTWDPTTGQLVRRYPWMTADDDPVPVTCLYSDGTWPLDALDGGVTIPDLGDDKATWAEMEDGRPAHRVDLYMDHVPLVADHGRAVLLLLAQLLEDLHGVDTDVMTASDLAALPLIALFGAQLGDAQVRPGAVITGPEGGRMDVLDLTAAVAELRHTKGDLLDRLSVNGQVPAEVIGRVDGDQQLAGIAIALRFGPFQQLIEALRALRRPKHRLMLTMVQRCAQLMGLLPPGPTPVAQVVPGAYLPSDVATAVELATKLASTKSASRRTGLHLLEEAGIEIGDITDELARIRSEDTKGAVEVADATGSEQLAAEHLGLELPAPTSPAGDPVITLPEPGAQG